MTKPSPAQKLALTAPQTIPLDKLEIHEDNVRKSAEDQAAIEDLAADIAARGLLQSLSVRPILDSDGIETGAYGIQAGSRRFRALKLLVKQKKLAKNAPIPCIVKTDGYAEADSLAENTQRQALTPLDEFRAFKAMADKGHGEATIAAAFRVSTLAVRQRLRLANASPVILKAYQDDEISLEQLMAYCVTDDHTRQEQVFESINTSWNKGADQIRRLLTEKSVSVHDKRARFIGADAYQLAGGAIERDLFSEEDDGYLIDVALVDRLVLEQLAAEAEKVRAEGWGWVQHAIDFPWNQRREFRAITPVTPALGEEEDAEAESLAQELDELESVAEEDRVPEDAERLAAINARLAELDAKQAIYSDEQKAKAGAFVSIDHDGTLLVERGYRRHADILAESKARPAFAPANADERDSAESDMPYETGEPDDAAYSPADPAANDDDSAELPDKLMTELTAYHSLGLRNALAADHRIAYLAVLNALVLDLFYRGYTSNNCLQIDAKDTLVTGFPGLAEFLARKEIDARHEAFQKLLPESEIEVWDALLKLDHDTEQALFAHCAGLTVNALHEGFGRSNKRRHALQLAETLRLDMGAQGFVTTAANYLGRIKKQQILETVAEAKGEGTAELLTDLKKKEMAAEAERLITDTGWLPEPLRPPAAIEEDSDTFLPAFLEEAELQAAE
ncbi:MAG: ParB/RepB/Spo0J family partition protein [Rhodomicrobium sp.]